MDDDQLWKSFQQSSIQQSDWDHDCHLRCGYLTLVHNKQFSLAFLQMKHLILALNAHHATPETPTRGFHYTATFFWLKVIDISYQQTPTDDSREFLSYNSKLRNSRYIHSFYSRPQLLSPQAKRAWVEADLKTLS